MTDSEFAQWVLEAEQLRDEMLKRYERNNGIDLKEYNNALNSK